MWYPDDVQHLESLNGLLTRWMVRWTRADRRTTGLATTHRATAAHSR